MNEHHRKVIYLIPSIITISAMFCGFYAIVQSISGDFIKSGVAILLAMILDGIDGRVARFTSTVSSFGAQLDSLSDMVAFGIAPAMIMFNWRLYTFEKLGWLIAFIYCACTGLRLARFNVQSVSDKRYFHGMPSPTAAALVVGYVYICADNQLNSLSFTITALIVTLVSGISMISNVKFYSFKELNFHQTAPFRAVIAYLATLVLIFYFPEVILYGFFIVYTGISYIFFAIHLLKKLRKKTY